MSLSTNKKLPLRPYFISFQLYIYSKLTSVGDVQFGKSRKDDRLDNLEEKGSEPKFYFIIFPQIYSLLKVCCLFICLLNLCFQRRESLLKQACHILSDSVSHSNLSRLKFPIITCDACMDSGNIMHKLYLYYTTYYFKCTFEHFKRYFQ